MNKRQSRLKRATRTRARIRTLDVPRLTVHRTPRHIYAQIIAPDGGTVLAVSSTLQQAVRESLDSTGSIAAAALVGRSIADKAKAAGISRVAFDRSGFLYHGRVKALADAARENGLEF